MKETNSNPRYEENLRKLRAWLYANEQERRKWSGEVWDHPDGRLFKISRVLFFVLGVYSILTFILYDLIFHNYMLYYEVEPGGAVARGIVFGIWFVSIMACGVFAGGVLEAFKKYFAGMLCSGLSAFLAGFYIATQLNFPMTTSNNLFRNVYLFHLVVYLLFIVCSVLPFVILRRDKKEADRMIEHTLTRIARRAENEEGLKMLTLDQYSDWIERFLAEEKEKQENAGSGRSGRRKKKGHRS